MMWVEIDVIVVAAILVFLVGYVCKGLRSRICRAWDRRQLRRFFKLMQKIAAEEASEKEGESDE